MAELKQLSEDAAAALLQKIAKDAGRLNGAEAAAHLANAYAAVVTNMPRTTAPARVSR